MSKKQLLFGTSALTLILLALIIACSITFSRTYAAGSWPVEQSGSRGENVTSVQYMLQAKGYQVQADGQFGSLTAQAVMSFQGKNGLTADGIVGPLTWEKLIVTTRAGDSGPAVVALQRQLNAHGSQLTTDGKFGSLTTQAVRSFQSKQGLTADGIAGAKTWNSLVGGSGGGNGGGGNGGGGTGSSTKLSQSEAASMLARVGISVSSSGNCSDRNNPHCTSLEQIRLTTIEGVIAFKQSSGCAITITGGTETGHASGTYSHWTGYKVDVAHTSCVTSYIHSHFTYKGLRGDGAPMYDDSRGNRYADEGSHWDILYY